MVQRLSRVNRRGEGDAAIIVVHGDEPKPKKPDAPTEQEKRQIIGFRSLAVFDELPNAGVGRDASPGALHELELRADMDGALRKNIGEATTPEPLRPALTRPHVDAWSMTSLETHTGRPEIAPWLRGWVDDDPQTAVMWRSHLPIRIDEKGRAVLPNEKEIEDFFEAAPPHESEKLETESYRVASWLQERANALLKRKQAAPDGRAESEDAGLEASTADDVDTDESEKGRVAAPARRLQGDDIIAIILAAGGEYEARYTLGDLALPRDSNAKKALESALSERTLIVDARFGGLKHGMLDPNSDDPLETADGTDQWSREAEFRVRRSGPDDEEREKDWRFEADFDLRRNEEGNALEKLVVEHFKDAAQREDARSISRPQGLAEHQSCAEQKARHIVERVGLSGIAAEALALAAFLHDEGKRASRWQRAFKAPRDAKKFGLSGPLAKTEGPINQAILDGYRHEFGSLPYAENNIKFKALPEDWRDLVLHLIASHHGGARPVISTRGCEDAPPSALEARARDVALRFARLQKRWGPWGLAWWEALLRAADQQASRDNDESKGSYAPNMEGR
jgi:CRISPR-associated endonuclease/helicase Cas3